MSPKWPWSIKSSSFDDILPLTSVEIFTVRHTQGHWTRQGHSHCHFFFFTPLSLSLFLSLVPFHLHLPPLLSPLSSIYVIVIDLDSIEICHTLEERLSIIWEDSIQVVTSSLSLKGHLSPFFGRCSKGTNEFSNDVSFFSLRWIPCSDAILHDITWCWVKHWLTLNTVYEEKQDLCLKCL